MSIVSFYGKTGRTVLTCSTACDAILESLTAYSLHGVVHIMIKKLSPLHHKLTDGVVVSDRLGSYNFRRDFFNVGQGKTVVKLAWVPT
jgi:hypothetical protein